MRTRLLFAALVLAGTVFAQSKPEDSITPEALRSHVRFLSDDLLEGRGTGTRGHEIAAHYSASELEGMGLKPGGDDGTFFTTPGLSLPYSPLDLTNDKLEIISFGMTAGNIAPFSTNNNAFNTFVSGSSTVFKCSN